MFVGWLSLFIILVLIEIATINLITIWFALGALITAICSLFIEDGIILLAIFTITSIISLMFTKKLVKRFAKKDIVPTNLDRVIGKIGIVTEEITRLEPGEVKIDGKRWTAISSKKITKNSKVEILSIDGVKLNVKEIKEVN